MNNKQNKKRNRNKEKNSQDPGKRQISPNKGDGPHNLADTNKAEASNVTQSNEAYTLTNENMKSSGISEETKGSRYTCETCKIDRFILSGMLLKVCNSHPEKERFLNDFKKMNLILPNYMRVAPRELSVSAQEFHPNDNCSRKDLSKSYDVQDGGSHLHSSVDSGVFSSEQKMKGVYNRKNEACGHSSSFTSGQMKMTDYWEADASGSTDFNDDEKMQEDCQATEDKSDERNCREDRQNDDRGWQRPRNFNPNHGLNNHEDRPNDNRERYRQRDYNRNQDRGNWRDQRDRGGRQEGRGRENTKYNIVSEIEGDLFTASEEYSLAHCVATDLRMGSGIAVTFKQNFKRVGELLDQKPRVGHICVLEDGKRYIYYLITKKYSTDKPYFEHLEESVQKMKDHCVANQVKFLAMPRIGCGLDRLEWREVRPMIENTFAGVDIKIVVYNFKMSMEEDDNSKSTKFKQISPRFVDRQIPLIQIEHSTALIFFGTEDSVLDTCGNDLDRKYNFMMDYRSKRDKKVGEVIRFEKKNECLYGLVVRKKSDDPFSYSNFEKCLNPLKKLLRTDNFEYAGFQAFRTEDGDPLTMDKIISVLKSSLPGFLEVHICWPEELQGDCKRYAQPETVDRGSTGTGW